MGIPFSLAWPVRCQTLPTCRSSASFVWYCTKLYCLVTEAHVCKQLAQSCYTKVERAKCNRDHLTATYILTIPHQTANNSNSNSNNPIPHHFHRPLSPSVGIPLSLACQALPTHRASPPFVWCQIILLGDKQESGMAGQTATT